MFTIFFSVNNCRNAMEIARREFQIPMVLEPEYLASPFLDELSGMTYLSYFMKEDSPGYHATLRWVNSQIPELSVSNFTVSNYTTGCFLFHFVIKSYLPIGCINVCFMILFINQ